MLKKTITYTDVDGENPITQDFYFSLSEADLAKLQLKHSNVGGFDVYLRKLIEKNTPGDVVDSFEEIILMSVGYKSDDGRSFLHDPKYTQWFQGTKAYSILFMQLVTDPKFSIEFVNGLVPGDLAEQVQKLEDKHVAFPPGVDENAVRQTLGKPQPLTREQLQAMTDEELDRHLVNKHPRDMTSDELQESYIRKTRKS